MENQRRVVEALGQKVQAKVLPLRLHHLNYAPTILEKFVNAQMCDIDASFDIPKLIINLSSPKLLRDVVKRCSLGIKFHTFRQSQEDYLLFLKLMVEGRSQIGENLLKLSFVGTLNFSAFKEVLKVSFLG